MRTLLLPLLLAATLLTGAGPAPAQADRRDRQFPELIPETGGRLGTCDALMFTPDGEELMAAAAAKSAASGKATGAASRPSQTRAGRGGRGRPGPTTPRRCPPTAGGWRAGAGACAPARSWS